MPSNDCLVLLWDTVPANAVRCFMLIYDSTYSLNFKLVFQHIYFSFDTV